MKGSLLSKSVMRDVTPTLTPTNSSSISSDSSILSHEENRRDHHKRSLSMTKEKTKNVLLVTFRWLAAIHDATNCLRRGIISNSWNISCGGRGRGRRKNVTLAEVEYSILYLEQIERLLEDKKPEWDEYPTTDPPPFTPYTALGRNAARKKNKNKKPATTLPLWETDAWNPGSKSDRTNYNRFASLDDDDDNEEEATQDKGNIDAQESVPLVDEEAGDVPLLNKEIENDGNGMAMRRIMVRVLTAQAELSAFQARINRRNQSSWTLGSDNFASSLSKVKQGLELANTEVSRCLAKDKTLLLDRAGLLADAEITEMTAKYITKEHASFVKEALAKRHRLMQLLAEQENQRRLARQRLGDEFWCNKKRGLSAQAKARLAYQQQALDVEAALRDTMKMTHDARSVVQDALNLKLRIREVPLQAEVAAEAVPEPVVPHNEEEEEAEWVKIEYLNQSDPSLAGREAKVDSACVCLYMLMKNEHQNDTEVEIRYKGSFWLEQKRNNAAAAAAAAAAACFRIKFQAYQVVGEDDRTVGRLSSGSIELPLLQSEHHHWNLTCLHEETSHIIRMKFPKECRSGSNNTITKLQLRCPRDTQEATYQAKLMFGTLKKCELKCRPYHGADGTGHHTNKA